ncbi:MAG: hypothetical protein AB1489_13155 [Acidobacteriota bacterium]
MSHNTHQGHEHVHGPNCGHITVKHNDHIDYLHDGHLHQPHEDHIDEHTLEVNTKNPADCTINHYCGGHDGAHKHGPSCGHKSIPHSDHVDHIVQGHLHHLHGDHCDDHGPVEIV